MSDQIQHIEKGTEEYKKSMDKYSQELLKDGWKVDSQGYKSLMALHSHLVSTPQEQLEKEWAEVEKATKEMEGPTVDEYFESTNPHAMYHKGYGEGAKRYKELVEEYFKGWAAQIKEEKEKRQKEDKERYERKLAEVKEKFPDQKFHFVSPGIEFKHEDVDVWHIPFEDIIENQILPELQNIFDNN